MKLQHLHIFWHILVFQIRYGLWMLLLSCRVQLEIKQKHVLLSLAYICISWTPERTHSLITHHLAINYLSNFAPHFLHPDYFHLSWFVLTLISTSSPVYLVCFPCPLCQFIFVLLPSVTSDSHSDWYWMTRTPCFVSLPLPTPCLFGWPSLTVYLCKDRSKYLSLCRAVESSTLPDPQSIHL